MQLVATRMRSMAWQEKVGCLGGPGGAVAVVAAANKDPSLLVATTAWDPQISGLTSHMGRHGPSTTEHVESPNNIPLLQDPTTTNPATFHDALP